MSNRNTLYMNQPACHWRDALPAGNGTFGAMVYGHIRSERILCNHERIWFRSAKPVVPDVSGHLPELRRLLAEGRYREASGFLDAKLKDAGYSMRIDPFQPAFDLRLEMETTGAFGGYRRSLDLETGEIRVAWEDSGKRYERKLFVSRVDDVIVLVLECSEPASVTCRFALRPHGAANLGRLGLGIRPAFRPPPVTFATAAEDDRLTISGRYEHGDEFGGVCRVVQSGGTISVESDTVAVAGADRVVVLTTLFALQPAATAIPELARGLRETAGDYAVLFQRHARAHRKIFRRVQLDLRPGASARRSNEELLASAYEGPVPSALTERLFHYGRYLLLASSRPGGLPANLQGVWNGDYQPDWDSDFHNDENIEMNYWQALPGNMPETTLPYFSYYESMLDDFRENARSIYGCRGILAPIAQSTHGKTYVSVWVNWTAGAGWLAQLFHDYWLFTGDEKFLRDRAIPFLKEVALFYEDFLREGPDGRLLFAPSLSPENEPDIPDTAMVVVNATMDVAIAREVLTNLCAACELLGIEAEGVERWRGLLKKMPEYAINEDGAIKEWIHPQLKDNYHHRHQSHIYPVFPGREVTVENNPRLFDACRTAVEKRLVVGRTSQTGWSMAHMANIYARLGDGDRALECLELLARSCVGPNLFACHNDWRGQGMTMFFGHDNPPPFQIDANFGFSAAILEMLVFSTPGLLKVLPALPAKWSQGRVQGILCRGGITVDMKWNMAARTMQVALRSRRAQNITVKFPGEPSALACSNVGREIQLSEYGPAYRQVALPERKRVTMEVCF